MSTRKSNRPATAKAAISGATVKVLSEGPGESQPRAGGLRRPPVKGRKVVNVKLLIEVEIDIDITARTVLIGGGSTKP